LQIPTLENIRPYFGKPLVRPVKKKSEKLFKIG
jgi:hypothetical protein